jgi:hypothetical protein
VGKGYHVAYKNNLSNSGWTDVSGLLTAVSPTTSYTDTTAGARTQGYYIVYSTN